MIGLLVIIKYFHVGQLYIRLLVAPVLAVI